MVSEESAGQDKSKKLGVSRRQFIAGTVGGLVVGAAAGAAVGSLGFPTIPASVSQPWLPAKWDQTTDVLIVGTGGAGLCAAIEAKAAGADVLIIEKDPYPGGLWQTAGGNSYFCNTDAQKKAGIQDNVEWGVADEMLISDWRANPEIVRTYVENGADTASWYENLGIVWSPTFTDGEWGSGVLRNHVAIVTPTTPYGVGGGLAEVAVLLKRVNSDGTPILLNHRMESIYRQPNGPVLGIAAATPQGSINIKANKAVVIACGSFTTNEQMVKAWDPRLVNDAIYSDGLPYTASMGDGLMAAMNIGAAVTDLSFVCYLPIHWGSHVYTVWGDMTQPQNNPLTMKQRPPTGSGISITGSGFQRIILVKNDGTRYINESIGAMTIERGGGGVMVNSEAVQKTDALAGKLYGAAPMYDGSEAGLTGVGAEFPEHPFTATFLSLPNPKNVWAVTDADGAKAMSWPVSDMANPQPPPTGTSPLWPDSVAVASTLAQLASAIHVDPTGFATTVSRYNGFVDAGADADYGKPMPMYKLQTPPFYAAKLNMIRHTPRNGLRVNTKGQVIANNYFVSNLPSATQLLAQGNRSNTVLSIDQEPVIPHLYAAGEVTGSLGWRRCHRSCGPYSTLGRITGKNAAAEPSLATS